MKRLFIAVILTLLLAALLASAMSYDAGYILITYGLYTIETSVWVGLVALGMWLVLCYLVVALFYRGVRRGGWWGQRRRQRRQHRAHTDTARGLIALIEGHAADARKWLVRSAKRSDEPFVPLLLAARAAAAKGDDTGSQELLRQASQSMAGVEAAIALTEAELALAADQPARALACLHRARDLGGQQPRLLTLLAELYERGGKWEELAALLPAAKREQALSTDAISRLERRAWIGRIEDAAREGSIERLRQCWRELPKGAERDTELMTHYTCALAQLGDGAAAAQLIATQLKRDWQPALVDLYGRVEGDAPRQLANVEQWLTQYPTDPLLLLSAGRLAQRNQLWGKARSYLESSLAIAPTAEAYAELGQLLDQLGEGSASAELYRRGLFTTLAGSAGVAPAGTLTALGPLAGPAPVAPGSAPL